MILGQKTKLMATFLRSCSEYISIRVAKAFENSIVGCQREVPYFRKFVELLDLETKSLQLPNIKFSTRIAELHQKPLVQTSKFRCELGDLLIVVKYHPLDSTPEARSVIYQVKMADRGSNSCKIDQNQLNLLTEWPEFKFGRRQDGGPQSHTIAPRTLEFGSYLLAPRGVAKGEYLTPWELDVPLEFGTESGYWSRGYGLGPTALECYFEGPHRVALNKRSHLICDVDAIVGQIVFARGEHHQTPEIKNLINALYRFVGLAPDPPDEFWGYHTENTDAAFVVLEINVEQKGELYPDDISTLRQGRIATA